MVFVVMSFLVEEPGEHEACDEADEVLFEVVAVIEVGGGVIREMDICFWVDGPEVPTEEFTIEILSEGFDGEGCVECGEGCGGVGARGLEVAEASDGSVVAVRGVAEEEGEALGGRVEFLGEVADEGEAPGGGGSGGEDDEGGVVVIFEEGRDESAEGGAACGWGRGLVVEEADEVAVWGFE